MGIEFWVTQPQTEEQKPDLEIRFLSQKKKKKVMELTMQLQFKTEIMTAECVRKERNTLQQGFLYPFDLLSQGIPNNLFNSNKKR